MPLVSTGSIGSPSYNVLRNSQATKDVLLYIRLAQSILDYIWLEHIVRNKAGRSGIIHEYRYLWITRKSSSRSTGHAAFRAPLSPVPIAERLPPLCGSRADWRAGSQCCGRAAATKRRSGIRSGAGTGDRG